MVFRVSEGDWIYEVAATEPCHIARDVYGRLVLVIDDGASGTTEELEPLAVVRAAKDQLLGLSCGRAWRPARGTGPVDPSLAIREVISEVKVN